jgi:DNA repair protein RadC
MRYRLKTATWIVVREPAAPPARVLSNPAAVRELARDLLRDADDDREHFWLVLLNSQHHYRLSTLISVGTLNASLVHPLKFSGRPCGTARRR